jgi:hypothetical protein
MSNHHHVLVRDEKGRLPEFLAHFHKMIAKVMNARLGRWENFWATEQPNAVYLVEAADRFDKLVYVLANPVADDLVDRVSDWPGASSLSLNLSGRTITVRRPKDYFRDDGPMPEKVTLRVERPDGYEELSDAEWKSELEKALRERERRARTARQESKRGVLGRKALLRAKPTDQPRSIERRRGLRPCVACLDAERRETELTALAVFRADRARARARNQAGERVPFPLGTYRVHSGHYAAAPPAN